MQSGSVSTAAFDGAAEASTARGTGRGQALATQTFALLKRNGKKGLTETPVPRRGTAAFSGLRRARRQRAEEGARPRHRGSAAGTGVGCVPHFPREGMERGDPAESPRSPAQRRRALLPPGGALPRPALRCPDGAAASPLPGPCPAAGGRSPAVPGPVVLIPPASGGGEGGDNIDERVA